jgi:homoserine O-acetyltransferase
VDDRPGLALDPAEFFVITTELPPGFDGDTHAALASIGVPVLVMPGETDLYFPAGDAPYEAQDLAEPTLLPIPSLWGHPAGAGASPADQAFVNDAIRRLLAGGPIPGAQAVLQLE